MTDGLRRLTVVLLEGFELLDVLAEIHGLGPDDGVGRDR